MSESLARDRRGEWKVESEGEKVLPSIEKRWQRTIGYQGLFTRSTLASVALESNIINLLSITPYLPRDYQPLLSLRLG